MFTPFIVLPIIARGLEQKEFEIFLVVQSTAIWMSMLIEFGFNITAPKIMEKIDNGVGLILFTKVFLSIIASLFSFIFFTLIGLDYTVSLLASIYVIFLGFNFYWYFLSKNDLSVNSKYELMSSLFTITLFLIIYESESLSLITCFLVLILGRSIAFIFSVKNLLSNDSVHLPKLLEIKAMLYNSFNAFIFRLGGSLYTVANGFILTFAIGVSSASLYLQAERLVKAVFMGCIVPLNNGLYTKILAGKVHKGVYIAAVLGVSIFISYLLYAFKSEAITYFYAKDNEVLENLLVLFIAIIPVISLINTVNFLYVFPYSLERYSSIIMLIAGLFNVCLAIPVIKKFDITGFIILNILMELFVLFSIYCVCKAKNE